VNDHRYPVAAAFDAVAIGRLGALYLYLLSPQRLVTTGVTVMDIGAAGGFKTRLISLAALLGPSPQLLNARTFMLSVRNDAALLVYLSLMMRELLMFPESTVTVPCPPQLVGMVHLYPVALAVIAAVYLYILELH
jgi:hypothetical protein